MTELNTNNNWKWKLAGIVGITAIILGLLVIIKYQRDMINKQEAIQTSFLDQKKIGDTTRAETSYVTAEDLDRIADEIDLNLDPIRADLKSLNADVKGVQVIRVVTPGAVTTNVASTTTTPGPAKEVEKIIPGTDPFGYQKNTQVLKLEEPFTDKKIPFGEVKFSAFRDKPWDVTVSGRKYSVVNVLGQDDDGKHYTYSKFMVEVDGKTYNIDVTKNRFVEEYPESKFRFNPNLFLGLDFGTYVSNPEFEAIPSLGVSLFSYGKTKVLPTWTFLGLGVGYEMNGRNLVFVLSPVDYNLGDVLPLVKNLYIGPAVGYDINGDFSVLGGIRVNL